MEIIGFNSYKGGACRTTTCYNTIPYLCEILGASEDRPLLVVDLDLDSMGLTKLFADGKICAEDRFDKTYSSNSLFDKDNIINIKFADDGFENVKDDEYFKNWAKVGKTFDLDNGSVLFLGANAVAKTISDKVFEQLEKSSPMGDLIKYLYEMDDECRPAGLIFDCAAGMQKSTQMAVSYVDTSVVCMRPTEQFRKGTLQYLRDNYRKMFEHQNCRGHRNVILLPTSVPSINASRETETYKKVVQLRSDAFDGIEWIINAVTSRNANLFKLNSNMVDADDETNMGIPEVERLKWKENVPLIKLEDYTEDEKLALERYKKLAKEIAK